MTLGTLFLRGVLSAATIARMAGLVRIKKSCVTRLIGRVARGSA
jgi:hypothetical protein